MNQKLILHFGAHKTATSLIQEFMRQRSDLMQQNGIGFVLRSETSRYIGWGHIGRGGRAPEKELPALRAAIDDGMTAGTRYFVVSHENSLGRPFATDRPGLYPSRDAALAKLLPVLKPFPKKLLYYIRAQDEFLESYYLQVVHEGGVLPFAQWLSQIDIARLSWRPVVESLQRAFGRDVVEVRDFAAEMKNGQQEFLRRAFASFYDGLEPGKFDNFSYSAPTNISVGAKGLEIALAINGLVDTPEERAAVRRFLQENFSNRSYPRPRLLGEAQKAEIQGRYRAENLELTSAGLS